MAIPQAAIARFGRITIWVNCAGLFQFGRIEDTQEDALKHVLDTNLFGYVQGARAALRRFYDQGSGILINVGSVLGVTGQPYASAYVASKSAIQGLTEVLQMEAADRRGVQVSRLLPSAIDTPVYQRASNYSGRELQPVWPRSNDPIALEHQNTAERRARRGL